MERGFRGIEKIVAREASIGAGFKALDYERLLSLLEEDTNAEESA